MAHPKRRQSKHRQGIRRANVGIKVTQVSHCARCGSTAKPHTVCDNCGYYGFSRGSEKKGMEVIPKDEF